MKAATPERLSMFSERVLAVLIMALVLELRPPELPTFTGLLSLWPTWVSYVFIVMVIHRLGQPFGLSATSSFWRAMFPKQLR
jgi:hypothetical protein